MSNITFNRADPTQDFPILRFVSEDGSCEAGLTPMLFGVRVRAGMVGASGVDIDYCAGADLGFQVQLLDVIKRIIETFPIGTTMGEIAPQLPTYKRRPISEDPCWQELQDILLKKEAAPAFHAELDALEEDPPFDPDDPDGEWAFLPRCYDPSDDEDECDCSEPHEIHETVKLTSREIGRLRHALDDSRNLPSAYEILADHGLMERTPNGFVSLDPQVIETRIRRLLGPTT